MPLGMRFVTGASFGVIVVVLGFALNLPDTTNWSNEGYHIRRLRTLLPCNHQLNRDDGGETKSTTFLSHIGTSSDGISAYGDLAVSKTIAPATTDQRGVRFTFGEFCKCSIHPQFGNPDRNFSSSTFGVASTVVNPGVGQLTIQQVTHSASSCVLCPRPTCSATGKQMCWSNDARRSRNRTERDNSDLSQTRTQTAKKVRAKEQSRFGEAYDRN
jgi:hypothetical protein